MPDNQEKAPDKIVLKIGKLSLYERPKTGPEDQPPVRLAITNLTLTRSGRAKPAPTPEPEIPEVASKSRIAKVIPLWGNPESRRWLVRKVLLPTSLALLYIALLFITDAASR